jgi:hypothetical protein
VAGGLHRRKEAEVTMLFPTRDQVLGDDAAVGEWKRGFTDWIPTAGLGAPMVEWLRSETASLDAIKGVELLKWRVGMLRSLDDFRWGTVELARYEGPSMLDCDPVFEWLNNGLRFRTYFLCFWCLEGDRDADGPPHDAEHCPLLEGKPG